MRNHVIQTKLIIPASEASVPTKSKPELKFHPLFDKKQSGDFILQADDESQYCFYFSSSLLCGLSSFFSGLPSPSPSDLVNDCPLIPLQDTPSPALCLVLLALRSFADPGPFWVNISLLRRHDLQAPTSGTFIESAVFSKRYDIPVLYRVLLEGVSYLTIRNFQYLKLLEFGIWSVAGVRYRLDDAALSTVNLDTTSAPRELVSALRQHTPYEWSQLRDLHLRRANAAKRLQGALQGEKSVGAGVCDECNEVHLEVEGRVRVRFRQAESLAAIDALWVDDCELTCSSCIVLSMGHFDFDVVASQFYHGFGF